MSEQPSMDEQYPDYKKPPFDREINFPVIAKAVAGLLVLAIVSFISMWWMYVAMRDSEIANDPKPAPFAEERSKMTPPNPRLQEFPPTDDIHRLWGEDEERMRAYAAEAGVEGVQEYRLPVERAIDILSERGLPGQGGDVDAISEELFGDTAPAATSAQVDEPEEGNDGGHE